MSFFYAWIAGFKQVPTLKKKDATFEKEDKPPNLRYLSYVTYFPNVSKKTLHTFSHLYIWMYTQQYVWLGQNTFLKCTFYVLHKLWQLGLILMFIQLLKYRLTK